MLLLVFIISMLLVVVGCILSGCADFYRRADYSELKKYPFKRYIYYNEWTYSFPLILGASVAIICFVVAAFIGTEYAQVMVIDEKIALYEEENAEIEKQIDIIVDDYMLFETSTFKDLRIEDPTTVLMMYPELESNELVSKQIELYVSNNAQIKALKEQKLDFEVLRWWLIF